MLYQPLYYSQASADTKVLQAIDTLDDAAFIAETGAHDWGEGKTCPNCERRFCNCEEEDFVCDECGGDIRHGSHAVQVDVDRWQCYDDDDSDYDYDDSVAERMAVHGR